MSNAKRKLTPEEMARECMFDDFMQSVFSGRRTQQHSVYNWEQNILDKGGLDKIAMTQESAQALVNKVLKYYKLGKHKVPVTFEHFTENGGGASTNFLLKENTASMHFNPEIETSNKYVVLHECSHAILHFYGLHEENEHGPFYVRMFANVASRFGGLDEKKIIDDAIQHNIAVWETFPVKPLQDLVEAK